MKHEDQLFESVALFIEETTGFPASKIHVDTQLGRDLGLDGDDAEDFFRDFSVRFEVSFDNLNLSDFFGGEARPEIGFFALPFILVRKILKCSSHDDEVGVITVGQLVQAALSRQWK